MGIITLTDRISVSVRAKNETERNSQRRATGKNIANALTSGGNANISDSLADQLGNTSKPTIADEQGREWVAMSDIIAAGKKMQQEGAFDEKTVYDGITVNGTTYKLENVLAGPISITAEDYWAHYSIDNVPQYDYIKDICEYSVPSGVIIASYTNGSSKSFVMLSKEKTTVNIHRIGYPYAYYTSYTPEQKASYSPDVTDYTRTIGRSNTTFIGDASYSYFIGNCELALFNTGSYPGNNSYYIKSPDIPLYEYDDGNFFMKVAGTLFGPTRTGGGSLIDWDKPDDEIEEDIRNLHETWDVSDHAGSVNANGTYVLAGPIEFNPGD